MGEFAKGDSACRWLLGAGEKRGREEGVRYPRGGQEIGEERDSQSSVRETVRRCVEGRGEGRETLCGGAPCK